MVIEQVHPRHRTLPRQKGGGRGDAGGYDEEAGWVLDVDDSTCAECPERLSVVYVALGWHVLRFFVTCVEDDDGQDAMACILEHRAPERGTEAGPPLWGLYHAVCTESGRRGCQGRHHARALATGPWPLGPCSMMTTAEVGTHCAPLVQGPPRCHLPLSVVFMPLPLVKRFEAGAGPNV